MSRLVGLSVNHVPYLVIQRIQIWAVWRRQVLFPEYGHMGRQPVLQLVSNSDTLPPPIDEEVVTQKALTWAYRDAESRKDVMAAKGSGGNYLALKKDSESDFLVRLKTLRLKDRDAVDSYFADMKSATSGLMPYYNPMSGTANMGIGYR